MKRVISFLKENAIYASILVILVLIVLTSALAFRNQLIMEETTALTKESETVTRNTTGLLRTLNLFDLGVRGYGLTRTDALLTPYRDNIAPGRLTLDTVRTLMKKQGLNTENFEKYAKGADEYVTYCEEMIALAKLDSMNQFIALLKEDRGYGLWQTYQSFAVDLQAHEATLKKEAGERYQRAVFTNSLLQGLLLFIGGPFLYLIYYRIRKQDKVRRELLINLEKNNRKYVFEPGTPISEDAAEIMNTSIQNIKNASDFIGKITKEDFQVTWPGMNDQNKDLNQDNLSATLVNMRDQMKKIQSEDRRRIWETEGLTKFTEIIRHHQDNVKNLSEESVRFIARYMDAQQGSVFVLQEDEEENQYLELTACFAFDKKKFIEKKIDIGQGLIGQTYLEGSTIVLKDVPSGYTHITSGLGDATPTCVLIVPMKYNEKTEGIVEIAGFVNWEVYQQNFLEKATEYMAAAIAAVRSTQKMKTVLEQMQTQTQQLHAQEEEMRQNMEELAATNEEMKRKEAEYLKKIEAEG